MSVGCEYEDNYFSFVDFIHKPVFLRYTPTPPTQFTTSQRLRMSRACCRMFHKLEQQLLYLSKCYRITIAEQ